MTGGRGQPWSGLEVVWCQGCDVPRYGAGMRVCVWCGALRERVFFVWRCVASCLVSRGPTCVYPP